MSCHQHVHSQDWMLIRDFPHGSIKRYRRAVVRGLASGSGCLYSKASPLRLMYQLGNLGQIPQRCWHYILIYPECIITAHIANPHYLQIGLTKVHLQLPRCFGGHPCPCAERWEIEVAPRAQSQLRLNKPTFCLFVSASCRHAPGVCKPLWLWHPGLGTCQWHRLRQVT